MAGQNHGEPKPNQGWRSTLGVAVYLLFMILSFGAVSDSLQLLKDWPAQDPGADLAKYGLDKPLYEQYLRYMGNALRGDFGISFQSPDETVIALISRTWPVSIALGGATAVLAMSAGLLLGTVAAVHVLRYILAHGREGL